MTTGVRTFTREDLPAVAALYERVVVGQAEGAAPEVLAGALERATLDHPWVDPELPSLVFEEGEGRIAGFQASYPRRMSLDGRGLRMVCCGQLVADPNAATLGIGGLLMRRMLRGAQDLTVTDGATAVVRDMWSRLGGGGGGLTSLSWTHVFKPARTAIHLAARHRGRARIPARSGRLPASTPDDELTPGALVELMEAERGLRPAYDVPFLEWLFGEMEVVRGRGPLARRVVRDGRGRPLGWYVAFLPSFGVAQVIGVGATRPDALPVLDRLLADAREAGAGAVQGRVEHSVLPALTQRRCFFRRAEWALTHFTDDGVAAAAGRERTRITRLDGEWWMGFHLRRRAPWGEPGGPATAIRRGASL